MDIVKQIFDILDSRSIRREKPYLAHKLKEKIENSVSKDKPIKLIGFWGVGLKKNINWADKEACNFLLKIDKKIKKVHKQGLHFTFIIAKPHGRHNGISEEIIFSYVNQIKNLFRKYRNFQVIELDRLWKEHNLNFKKINLIWNSKPPKWWEKTPYSKLLEKLAAKRNSKYNAKEAAQKYVIMRQLEKNIVEKEFRNYIFHTYSSSHFRYILPELPTLHIWSLKRGKSAPSWFIYD